MSHPRLVEGEVRVIGLRRSPRVHEIKAFLARSGVPFRWLEVEGDGAAVGAAERARPAFRRFPVVLFRDGSALEEPDVRAVAQKLGLETRPPEGREYDLVVVGAGPAGLTASIHGASEGLRTVVVEQEVPGGQAGHSAIVENYPGFPRGLSGSDLARRTLEQAERFGAEIVKRIASAVGEGARAVQSIHRYLRDRQGAAVRGTDRGRAPRRGLPDEQEAGPRTFPTAPAVRAVYLDRCQRSRKTGGPRRSPGTSFASRRWRGGGPAARAPARRAAADHAHGHPN